MVMGSLLAKIWHPLLELILVGLFIWPNSPSIRIKVCHPRQIWMRLSNLVVKAESTLARKECLMVAKREDPIRAKRECHMVAKREDLILARSVAIRRNICNTVVIVNTYLMLPAHLAILPEVLC